VVSIPKNQNVSDPSNYRPISLLPVLSKILECHVFMLIMDHLQRNQPLSAFQWGFLEGRSTVTALLHLTDQWLQALIGDRSQRVCSVLQFSKGIRLCAALALDEKAPLSWAS
jgi:hypothetical protein